MGEISFKYQAVTEAVQEMAFKYWLSESIEYGFAYQRYVAFSDASIFNSPVVITKVATGLSDLRDLFAARNIYTVCTNSINGLSNEIGNAFTTDNYSGSTEIKSLNKDKILSGVTSIKSANDKNGFNAIGNRKYMYTTQFYEVYTNENIGNAPYWAYSGNKLFNDGGNTHKDIFGIKRYDNIVNANNFYGAINPYTNIVNVFQNPIISSLVLELYIQELYELAPESVNHVNIMEQITSKPKRKLSLNQLITYGAKSKNEFKTNITSTVSGKNIDKHLVTDSSVSLERSKDIFIAVQGIVQSTRSELVANYLSSIQVKRLYQQACCVSSHMFGHKYGKETSRFNNHITMDLLPKRTFFEKQYFLQRKHGLLCGLDLEIFDIFVEKDTKQTLAIDGISIFLDMETIGDTEWEYFWTDKNIKSCYQSTGVTLDLDAIDTVTQSGTFLQKNHKSAFIDNVHETLDKGQKQTSINNKYERLDKCRKWFKILYTTYFIERESYPVRLQDRYGEHVFMYKDGVDFEIKDDATGYRKDRISFELESHLPGYKKESSSFVLESHLPGYLKDSSRFSIIQKPDFVWKIKKGSSINYNQDFAYRLPYTGMEWYFFGTPWLEKGIHNINHFIKDILASKENYFAGIFENGQSLIKKIVSMDYIDFDSVIRNDIPANYVNALHHGFGGLMIPVSKVKNQAYIDNINVMVQKTIGKGFLSESIFASVLSGKMQLELGLMCDRKEHNLYLEYKNLQITRTKLYLIISKDIMAQVKARHLSDLKAVIWADRTIDGMWLTQGIKAFRKANNVFIDEGSNVFKKAKDTFTKEFLGASKVSYKINTQDSLFVDKLSQMCYYDYGFTWGDGKEIDMQIQTQLQGYRDKRNIHMLDCIGATAKKELKGFYDHEIFGNKFISESELFKQIAGAHQISKELNILPNDFGNWVWVYEDPDPFDGVRYGIDELLLPENDTRYEDFENIIFDKEQMRPKNPVKKIDETTFIAKYPIKHPTPDYDKIGIEYIDVETSIMHTIFLKYYRIWQSKIFEFGTMTMVQSVKQMLDYIYVWIMEYFPVDQLEQALRVFRQIRWYSETSIIRNSQYIVSYEYGTLESKLTTGTCLIPNDLLTNHSMYVDASLGVIRNNPAYIGTQDAYVTFEIDNRKNTTFTFSLSNTIGSVNIYINNVLVDTVSRSALNLTYPLPYTGDVNIVKIEKTASHNLNGTFYIGNIKVPNGTFKNLSIEFDPTLKAGNKPLDEVAKKMIAFANLHDNRQEVYDIIKKGNLGVSETYKKLAEYWELHHQNKTKGKRLTIKET